jgi:hypothetical protein
MIGAIGVSILVPALALTSRVQAAEAQPTASQQLSLDQAQRLASKNDRPIGYVDAFGLGVYDKVKHRITSHTSPIYLIGWAAQVNRGVTGSAIILIVDGRVVQVGSYGRDRQDVGNHFGNSALRYCGFSIYTPKLSRGIHKIGFGLVNKDRTGYSLIQGMPDTFQVES